MKNLIPAFILLVIIITAYSCKDQLIGKWDDNIKLSTKNVEFGSAADSVIITTKGEWWWITDISIDLESFYDFRDIDQESDHYTIVQNGITVERRDLKTMFIKVEANPLDRKRVISVGLEAGDYFDRVYVNQAAE
jgi:hypothetical protein